MEWYASLLLNKGSTPILKLVSIPMQHDTRLSTSPYHVRIHLSSRQLILQLLLRDDTTVNDSESNSGQSEWARRKGEGEENFPAYKTINIK